MLATELDQTANAEHRTGEDVRARPLCHTMRVSEITPMVEVGACMRVAKKSVGHTGRADIFTQIIICLFLHADILRYIVLQVCKTRYDGEL